MLAITFTQIFPIPHTMKFIHKIHGISLSVVTTHISHWRWAVQHYHDNETAKTAIKIDNMVQNQAQRKTGKNQGERAFE